MTSPDPQKPRRLRVEPGFRVFLYIAFISSVLGTIALLGWGGAWWAPMFGSIFFGIPAVIVYLTEEERQQDLLTISLNQQARASTENQDDWDSAMKGGDPTVPPAPPERTR
jgi:hypothetical protein